jgi:glycosyltransferase involved in cell wall biosynthesis
MPSTNQSRKDIIDSMFSVLQINTMDIGGGAEKVAWNLFNVYRNLGYKSSLAVGKKFSEDPDIYLIPNITSINRWARNCISLGDICSQGVGKIKGAGILKCLFYYIGNPRRYWEQWIGHEDYHYPASRRLLEFLPFKPDLLHCHNLHGGYFDLRVIPIFSKILPVIITLHDAWLMSGHCAHHFDCEKWKIGCDECSDLSIAPSISRDSTFYNWQTKKHIFADSRLYVATPCKWLMKKVEESIIKPAVIESKVIPNGVDLTVFHPAEKNACREKIGIPRDASVLLFAANGIRQNIWKDYECLRKAVSLVNKQLQDKNIYFLALGENAPDEFIDGATIRFIPYQKDSSVVASYYQAADLYLHAARVDTFPNTIIEALACGTPVVATAVGGIPEQVNNIDNNDFHSATGMLSPQGDAYALAGNTERLLTNEHLRLQLSENAVKEARMNFDINKQATTYIKWYEEILQSSTWKKIE